MLKNISQDDFFVLLIEGFALGITTGIIFDTRFSPKRERRKSQSNSTIG